MIGESGFLIALMTFSFADCSMKTFYSAVVHFDLDTHASDMNHVSRLSVRGCFVG